MVRWTDFLNKRIFLEVETSNGIRNYSGNVEEVTFMGKNTDGVETYIILITDKFDKKVAIISTQIKLIQEEK